MDGTLLREPTSVSAIPASASSPVPSWHVVVFTVLLLNAAWKFAYLLLDCPIELAPDEAHYWDWSRQLDWCYYSKGPLVAWLIAASVELFGTCSIHATGSELVAIRLPAIACQFAILSGLYFLALRTLDRPSIAAATVGIAMILPPVTALGTLMTIDSPFLACWMWACVGVHSALVRDGGTSAWLATGFMTAIGILAKYTMLMFPACVLVVVLTQHGRPFLRSRGFWGFLCVSALGTLPILYWNAVHDGIGLRHLLSHANGPANKPKPLLNVLGPFEFLGSQFAMLLGFWFIAFAAAGWTQRPGPGRERPETVRLLWWLSVPLWLFFAVVTLRAKGQPNWPAPAYLTGLILAVNWVHGQFAIASPNRRRWLARGIAGSVAVGVAVSAMAHYPRMWRPLLTACLPEPTFERPTPIRKLDPTCRVVGWRELAGAVDRLRERVRREDGQEPILAGMLWTLPGELAFYCDGHPTVYSFAVVIGERHSQYDIWRPNPVTDAQDFRGRTFVYVGERMPEMERAFDRVESPVEVIASDGGIPIAAWKLWICHGFHGFSLHTGQNGY